MTDGPYLIGTFRPRPGVQKPQHQDLGTKTPQHQETDN